MKITLIPDTDMNHWYPGTAHYACEDGTFIAVHADQHMTNHAVAHTTTPHGKPAVKRGRNFIVKTPTVILPCSEEGVALSMTPLFYFDPDTTVKDALKRAGYVVST